ncbi:hypothetical protein IFM89_003398 [Coptis chinensis]|uniref:Uncharacterized protein n=1 Tax=Coptis chinensis TaxID=261450 RepID=A0A835GUA7_9MAGN|nr:hypothetical protein IFM89_003398 [Coptis chinensis]
MLDDNEMDAKNLPLPLEVVSLYQSNHIGRMRLSESDSSMFEAHRVEIQILLGGNDTRYRTTCIIYTAKNDWVEKNIRHPGPMSILSYIVVGNEAIPSSYAPFVLPKNRKPS